jgi:hypothetical protein
MANSATIPPASITSMPPTTRAGLPEPAPLPPPALGAPLGVVAGEDAGGDVDGLTDRLTDGLTDGLTVVDGDPVTDGPTVDGATLVGVGDPPVLTIGGSSRRQNANRSRMRMIRASSASSNQVRLLPRLAGGVSGAGAP